MAREVIIVLNQRLPALLHGWLREREQHPCTVSILTGQPTEAAQARYLAALEEEGFDVFEAVVPPQEMVFLDRRAGYYLPGWEPIPDPFSLACTLMWRRLGSYMVLEGVVERVNPVFFTLVGNQAVLVHYGGLDSPAPGEGVRILALCSFIGGWSVPFPVFAQWIERGEPDHEGEL